MVSAISSRRHQRSAVRCHTSTVRRDRKKSNRKLFSIQRTFQTLPAPDTMFFEMRKSITRSASFSSQRWLQPSSGPFERANCVKRPVGPRIATLPCAQSIPLFPNLLCLRRAVHFRRCDRRAGSRMMCRLSRACVDGRRQYLVRIQP